MLQKMESEASFITLFSRYHSLSSGAVSLMKVGVGRDDVISSFSIENTELKMKIIRSIQDFLLLLFAKVNGLECSII